MAWSLCITNLKITDSFLKKMGIIVAIKSQRYLSTFCPTAQLHITGIFLKTVLNKQYSSNFAIFIITTHIFQKSMNYMNNIK